MVKKPARLAAKIALFVIAIFVLIPIVIALMSTPVHAAEVISPDKFESLKPFKQFAEGTGHGMAREYKPRNKAEFVALLRSPKKLRLLRVDCERLVGQMAEIHKLPFENCEGAATEIARNGDYDVVACRSGMFDRDNKLTVTNSDGSAFGVWQRECLADETVLVYKKNQTIASTMCANVAAPISPVPQVPLVPLTRVSLKSSPVATGACPNGYLLVANAWSLSAMPQRLRDTAMKLVNEAEERDSENASKMEAYKPSAFSRTLGGQLRREVKIRADVNTSIVVNLRDPVSFRFIQTLGAMEMVNGIGKMSLTKDQVAMVVETIWPNGFVSPAVSGGERRVELFFPEWGDRCEMNVHGAKKP